jgi:curved DNA-binding protein CbpA/CheY-like chemotaxis protein
VAASVLCIESDPGLSEILSRALREQGLRVTESSEAVRALALAHEDPPDLVLLSIELSEGAFAPLEALRDLPEAAGRMPVILLCDRPPAADEALRAAELAATAVLTKPVPLARLLAVVSEQLAKTGSPVAARSASASDEGVAGRLERMPFAFLLHHLHGLRADGVLHLAEGRKRKWVQLRGGQPAAVRSNLVSECLGNLLVRAGRLAPEVVAESRRRMGAGQLQGEILVSMDALAPEEMAEALREQADEKFFELFAWTEGEFRFERDGRLQRANGIAGGRGTASMILHGVRTRAPLEWIDTTLSRRSERRIARTESPFYRFQDLALEAELREWIEGLDGSVLGHVLELDEERRRCLYAMLATGFLTLRPGVSATAERLTSAPRRAVRRAEPMPISADDERVRAELAELAARAADPSPFAVLGVEEGASEDEIRAAYEQLLERVHPDRVGAASHAARELAERVFSRVESAWELLRDPRRRQEQVLARRRAGREAAERDEGRRAVEAELLFQKGEAALRSRSYDAALRCFQQAAELFPDEGEYHAHVGWALHLTRPEDPKRAEEALRHIKRGIKLASDREKPYLFLGRVCKAMGREDVAVKMFTRAAQIQPECVEALRELRLINMRREKEKGFIARLLRR